MLNRLRRAFIGLFLKSHCLQGNMASNKQSLQYERQVGCPFFIHSVYGHQHESLIACL